MIWLYKYNNRLSTILAKENSKTRKICSVIRKNLISKNCAVFWFCLSCISSPPQIIGARITPFESCLVFTLGYKLSEFVSRLELETELRFAHIWSKYNLKNNKLLKKMYSFIKYKPATSAVKVLCLKQHQRYTHARQKLSQ